MKYFKDPILLLLIALFLLFGFNYYKKYFFSDKDKSVARKTVESAIINKICIESETISECYDITPMKYKLQLFPNNGLENNILILNNK